MATRYPRLRSNMVAGVLRGAKRDSRTYQALRRTSLQGLALRSGADRDRTGDPLLAKQVLSQLSYRPEVSLREQDSDRTSHRVSEGCVRKCPHFVRLLPQRSTAEDDCY